MSINEPQTCVSKLVLTINEIMTERFYESKNQLRNSGYQKYNAIFTNHISERLGELPIKYLTPQIITQFTDDPLSEELAGKTVNLNSYIVGNMAEQC